MAATLAGKLGRECPRRRESPGSTSELSPRGTGAGGRCTRGPRRGKRHGRGAGAVSDRPRLRVDVDRGLVRLRADYDPELVERIRRLPSRRYLRDSAEWTVPATRPGLAAVCELVEDAALDAELSKRARQRLSRHGPGRVELAGGELRLAFRYHPRRLERVREIPERRFDRASKTWTVPATRAGALALLALLADGEFRADPSVRARLESIAAGRASSKHPSGEDARGGRSSPIPHWRHVTRGPVFDASTDRHEWIEGIGWCVRIRVDPERHRRHAPEETRAA
jgi:hypothetical protein